jgi:hypothetical protein
LLSFWAKKYSTRQRELAPTAKSRRQPIHTRRMETRAVRRTGFTTGAMPEYPRQRDEPLAAIPLNPQEFMQDRHLPADG